MDLHLKIHHHRPIITIKKSAEAILSLYIPSVFILVAMFFNNSIQIQKLIFCWFYPYFPQSPSTGKVPNYVSMLMLGPTIFPQVWFIWKHEAVKPTSFLFTPITWISLDISRLKLCLVALLQYYSSVPFAKFQGWLQYTLQREISINILFLVILTKKGQVK